MNDMSSRLRSARISAGITSARQAAMRFGWTISTYAAHENGQNDFDPETAVRYGRAFKVDPAWLLTGRAAAPPISNVVPVIGVVSAGGLIESSSEQLSTAEPLFEIEIDEVSLPEDAFALQVRGDSMWPRYDDGDVVICYRHSQDPDLLLGWEAVVATGEGDRYLKRLLRGSEAGLFNLESHNAQPIRDVVISWASEVRHVVRASRWRRLDAKEKRREVRKGKAA